MVNAYLRVNAMMLPQSSSFTMTFAPGTAWYPRCHHSGSSREGVPSARFTCFGMPVQCLASHAERRRDAPLAAARNDRRTLFSEAVGVRDNSAYRFCSCLWNECRRSVRSCISSPSD